jgi:hypothetical protein
LIAWLNAKYLFSLIWSIAGTDFVQSGTSPFGRPKVLSLDLADCAEKDGSETLVQAFNHLPGDLQNANFQVVH